MNKPAVAMLVLGLDDDEAVIGSRNLMVQSLAGDHEVGGRRQSYTVTKSRLDGADGQKTDMENMVKDFRGRLCELNAEMDEI